jgi:transposase InsO family protein
VVAALPGGGLPRPGRAEPAAPGEPVLDGRRVWTVDGRPRVEVHGPNDLWTIDLKGWWFAQNRERCEPLTVRDAFSRKVLAVRLLESHRAEDVRRVMLDLFELHGLPLAIQSDNGPPFVCTRARGGLSRLAAWLLTLGIRLVRSRPGCPQDNGGHERMHRDLSELQQRPARSRRAQQRACDRWMVEFNDVRPHDALAGRTPAEIYRPSERPLLGPIVSTYPPGWEARRVSQCGLVSIKGDLELIPFRGGSAASVVRLRHGGAFSRS